MIKNGLVHGQKGKLSKQKICIQKINFKIFINRTKEWKHLSDEEKREVGYFNRNHGEFW